MNIDIENISLAIKQFSLYRDAIPTGNIIAAVLADKFAELRRPIIFQMAPNGQWLIGDNPDEVKAVEGNARGLLAAWTAIEFGSVNLAEFHCESQSDTTSLRNSINDACAKWAKRYRCPELARVFADRFEVTKSQVIYRPPPGSRPVETQHASM